MPTAPLPAIVFLHGCPGSLARRPASNGQALAEKHPGLVAGVGFHSSALPGGGQRARTFLETQGWRRLPTSFGSRSGRPPAPTGLSARCSTQPSATNRAGPQRLTYLA